jgi:hypothetical protein
MRAMLLILLSLSCLACHYEIRDPQSGEVYYTEKWVASDGYRGPLRFTDRTGRQVELREAQVDRLSRDDYLDAVETAERKNQNQ